MSQLQSNSRSSRNPTPSQVTTLSHGVSALGDQIQIQKLGPAAHKRTSPSVQETLKPFRSLAHDSLSFSA